jgi:tetratricopeptide (TPR) repeat protein
VNKGLSLTREDMKDVKMNLLDTRGTILLNMADRLADARSDFERLVTLSPSDTRQQARALLQLGRVCAKLNDFAQAKQHLETALQIDKKTGAFTADERSEIERITQKDGT